MELFIELKQADRNLQDWKGASRKQVKVHPIIANTSASNQNKAKVLSFRKPQPTLYRKCKQSIIVIFGNGVKQTYLSGVGKALDSWVNQFHGTSTWMWAAGLPVRGPPVSPRARCLCAEDRRRRPAARSVCLRAGELVTVGRLWPVQPALAGLYSELLPLKWDASPPDILSHFFSWWIKGTALPAEQR